MLLWQKSWSIGQTPRKRIVLGKKSRNCNNNFLRLMFGLITILEDKDGFMGVVLTCALKSLGVHLYFSKV